jgi:hypothetical protein
MASQIALELILIHQVLVPGQVTFVMVLNFHKPRTTRHLLDALSNLTVLQDLFHTAKTTECIHAGVSWIVEDAQYPAVCQVSPNQFAIPNAAISSLGKFQPALCKLMSYAIGAARFVKEAEDESDRSLHFGIGVQDDLMILPTQSHRQWKSQFAPLGFVVFPSLEATAEKMQFCGRHRALQP